MDVIDFEIDFDHYGFTWWLLINSEKLIFLNTVWRSGAYSDSIPGSIGWILGASLKIQKLVELEAGLLKKVKKVLRAVKNRPVWWRDKFQVEKTFQIEIDCVGKEKPRNFNSPFITFL